MIVKNEEKQLQTCLNSIKGFADEIIIVDTGSTDKTKGIAKKFTDKIYDFKWNDDFSAARNYSFEKATKEYIYVADADEIVDKNNFKKLMDLKNNLTNDIEMVNMKYVNRSEYGIEYNYDDETRTKLFKRVRMFKWTGVVHENVEVAPKVFESDIEIIHNPSVSHVKRDFILYQKTIKAGSVLSSRLTNFYAKELYMAGEDKDFLEAKDYFLKFVDDGSSDMEEFQAAACITARASRISNDIKNFFSACLKLLIDNPCSEVCYEVGEYYFGAENYKEAAIWFYNAVSQCEASFNRHYSGDYPLLRLSECYTHMGNYDQAAEYDRLAYEWQTE